MWPLGDKEIKLAVLGMVDGNGHPYSWSAIFNGYNREVMEHCPFAGIPAYLFKEPPENFGIHGAKVTHIHTQNRAQSEDIAQAACVPEILKKPEDAIGKVDAVIVATDIGHEHVERCRPFVEAGVPLFVDKPLVDTSEDLRVFKKWVDDGAVILSSSSARYTKEYLPYRLSTNDLGALRFACVAMAKTWERYGIHALEGVYPITGPGYVSVTNTGSKDRNIVHLEHACGADVVLAVTNDMYGGFGSMLLVGVAGNACVKASDTFYSFKAQLVSFVDYLRTGQRPFPFEETVELMRIIVAGIRSRKEGGRKILLTEIEV
jgi:predicted dehydrogenase